MDDIAKRPVSDLVRDGVSLYAFIFRKLTLTNLNVLIFLEKLGSSIHCWSQNLTP